MTAKKCLTAALLLIRSLVGIRQVQPYSRSRVQTQGCNETNIHPILRAPLTSLQVWAYGRR